VQMIRRQAKPLCRLVFPTILLLLLPALAAADKGMFEVRTATSRLDEGIYYLNATIDYDLSPQAIDALNSGIPLTFDLEIEISRSRKWWFDPEVALLTQSFQLTFNALSRRYVVRNLNSGVQQSYSTLYSALGDMGRIVDIPIIDTAILEDDLTHLVRIRAVLDQQRLPGPLQMLAFWSDGYRLESDWYSWSLSDG